MGPPSHLTLIQVSSFANDLMSIDNNSLKMARNMVALSANAEEVLFACNRIAPLRPPVHDAFDQPNSNIIGCSVFSQIQYMCMYLHTVHTSLCTIRAEHLHPA